MGKQFKQALIVGASSGMGASLAATLAAQGAKVAIVARREDALRQVAEGIHTAWGPDSARIYKHDVTDVDAIAPLFADIVQDLGGLDLTCYAAGYLEKSGEDEYPTEKDRRTIDVGLTGAIAWLNEAATYFTKQKHGTIVGISSIAGDRGRRAFPGYHAAKAGLTAYLEALRNRLAQHGVQVTTIKPGFIDTPMTRGMEGLFWLKSSDEAARMIAKSAAKGRQTSYVPGRWRFVSLVIRSIPSFIFRRMSI